MPDSSRLTLRGLDAGPVARRLLAQPDRGRVFSVFERSAYVELPGGLVCLGGEELPRGPLTLRFAWPGGFLWQGAALTQGTPVRLDKSALLLGQGLRIDLQRLRAWRPEDGPWTPLVPEKLERGLADLVELARQRVPHEGLARLVLGLSERNRRSPVESAAEEALGDLRDWLAAVWRGEEHPAPGSLLSLIGLGPGLTPSGDDVLAAVMIALRHLGRVSLAESLFAGIQEALPSLTSPVSAAYLAAAAEGWGAEPLHEALDALVAGDRARLQAALAGLQGVGELSGWDGLAGLTLVLRARAPEPLRGSRAA